MCGIAARTYVHLFLDRDWAVNIIMLFQGVTAPSPGMPPSDLGNNADITGGSGEYCRDSSSHVVVSSTEISQKRSWVCNLRVDHLSAYYCPNC